MTRHPLSIVGAWITTLSAFVLLLVFVIDMFGAHSNPYVGLVFFLILPGFFVLGLALIPLGIAFERRRRMKGLSERRMPRIDLNDPVHQRVTVIVLGLTIVNVLLVSLAAYRGVEYMESPQFCGQVCHTVMQPEFVAHRDGPHSQVACVECHVGSGAQSYVYYKLNGLRQLAHLVRNNYPRPVPSPVFNLRPARNTCETCDWREKFHSDKVVVVPSYASDEKNTSSPTRLVLHVGGGMPQLGLGAGIHWHTNPQNEIEYVATDEKRQEIPYVRLTGQDGKFVEFRTAEGTDEKIAAGERRRMDCADCHEPADARLLRRRSARSCAMAGDPQHGAVRPASGDRGGGGEHEDRGNRRSRDPRSGFAPFTAPRPRRHAAQGADLDRLVTTAQFLYARHAFPAMNVSFGTHPNNLGHTDAPGCFRCHDDQHKSPEGRVIRQDCDLCHEIQ
jgi:hypothetical protein